VSGYRNNLLEHGRLTQRGQLPPPHAFYLGGELARAEIALKVGRSYAQDDEW